MREGGSEGVRKGRRKGREGGREAEREGVRKGRQKEERQRGRERGREGEGGCEHHLVLGYCTHSSRKFCCGPMIEPGRQILQWENI